MLISTIILSACGNLKWKNNNQYRKTINVKLNQNGKEYILNTCNEYSLTWVNGEKEYDFISKASFSGPDEHFNRTFDLYFFREQVDIVDSESFRIDDVGLNVLGDSVMNWIYYMKLDDRRDTLNIVWFKTTEEWLVRQ